MPDGKITRQKLRDHFRRLWLVYLVGIVLLCFVNHLVYTVTRPGFSDDETLKIMLLNADPAIDEQALLQDVQSLGFQATEILPIAAAAGDPTSQMLVTVQLTGGFCDIYIADEVGLQLLMDRGACLPLEDAPPPGLTAVEHSDGQTGERYTAAWKAENGYAIAAAANGTEKQSALAAMGRVAQEMME